VNRIILIGNGFDLAHGLKTKYSDFLDDYWLGIIDKIVSPFNEATFENEELIIKKGRFSLNNLWNYKDLIQKLPSKERSIEYKNRFFGILIREKSIHNWVDIESEFYKTLLKIIKNQEVDNLGVYSIRRLNEDFGRIIQLLDKYLLKIKDKYEDVKTLSDIRNVIGSKIYSTYYVKEFTNQAYDNIIDYIYNKKNIKLNEDDRLEVINSIKKLLIDDENEKYFTLSPSNLLFLNFNYTRTIFHYENKYVYKEMDIVKDLNIETINIHGSLNEEDANPIIFGYGDELDDNYPAIEKLNDNKYLENIKSIKYSETDNYKRLLEYINSEQYQVFIFGHSCGLSDRTLLNTLFEHENCVSIKPYYHQWKNKDDSLGDNYSDIVRNISRNFNDKASMRDKVVNKTYCEPLLPIL